MSESTFGSSYGQSSYSSTTPPDMSAAAAEFRRNVQEASDRLSNAGQQLVSLSEALAKAIGEANAAADRAEAAVAKAEAVQMDMERDYGAVADLVSDLQERIGALAILARPLPSAPAEAVTPAAAAPTSSEPAGYEAPVATSEPDYTSSETPQTPPSPPSSGYGESGASWPSRNW
jgi:hypothetical protein